MTPDQFLLFAGTLPEPLFLLSSEGEILEANAAAHRLLGAAARKLCGIRIHDLVQEDTDKLDQHLRLWARSREMLPAPLRLCAADGSVVECHCGGALVQPRTDDRPALLLLRCQQKQTLTRSFAALNEQIERLRKEITMRKRTEERLQTLARVSPVGIFRTDAEGNCIYTNERWRELAGMTEAEALGEGWARALHPEDRERVFTEWYQAAADNIPFKTECRFQRPDGKVTWLWTLAEAELDAGGQVVGYVGAITDITERKRTEETVRNIAAGVSAQTGEAFFQSLVAHLAKIFDAEYTFIGLLDEQRPDMVDTVALCIHGEVVANLSYELANTPCEHVVDGNCDELQAYPRDIQRLFPDDPMLEEMGAHSYVGAPLADTTSKPIGLIVVMDNKPMENTDQVETILRIFAARAAAEMERLRADKALQESQKMLQLVLDSIPVRVFWKDRDSVYLGCNQHFAKDAGLESPEQIIGKNDFELSWHQQAELYRSDDQQVMQSGVSKMNYEELQTSPDETHLWLKTSKIPLKDLDGNVFGVLGVYEDITERKRAEEALRESERYNRMLFEQSTIGLALCRMNGELVDINPAYARIMGRTIEETLSLTYWNITPEKFTADEQHQLESLNKTGHYGPYEKEYIHKDGHLVPVSLQGLLLEKDGEQMIWSSVEDITERKQAEEVLQEKEARIRMVVESALDAVIVIDEKSVIIEWNPQAEVIFGWKPLDAIGRTLMETIIPPQYHEAHQQGIEKVLSTGTGPILNRHMELTALHREGCEFPIELTVSPLRHGETWIFSAFVRDLTERKQAEEELEKHREHLEELVAERTAELKTVNKELESFSHSVSHDLRAPLRAIDGFSLAVLEDNADRLDTESRENLERVRRGAQRMSELIDDMLQLSRVTRQEIRQDVVDLSALAALILGRLEESEPDRNVEQIVTPGMKVQGDSHLLQVVLDNLFSNAWKYTGKTGNPRIEFGMKEQDGETVYFVKDNGAGFDMQYAGKLFGAFQRMHKEEDFPGTGIGLATVQRIIHRHGGRTWAEAEKGKGATFYFTLPKA